MTIKEIEELAGMSRANIRFYEKEGLLSPARNVNGYRDYSKEDVEVLKKIKLLRSLHISLEEIKALHTGQQELSVTLEQHLERLASDKEDLDKAQLICESMYQDQTSYENLDAEKYLNNLKSDLNSHRTTVVQKEKFSWENYWDTREAYEDTLPKIRIPWRRYFARVLDETFYTVIWLCFLMLVFDVNLMNRSSAANILDTIMTLILTFLLEPLQLAMFGTTLGKWILGIHIRHNDDRKLYLSEAYERTVRVLACGLGLYIPVYQWIRQWKSYKACSEGETLEWEYDSRIILKDERLFRVVTYIAVQILFVGMLLFSNVLSQIPLHRGDLTIAQFCQNYRELEAYYGIETGYTLTNQGEWKPNTPDSSTVIIYAFGQQDPPAFVFETDEDGRIQSISFMVEVNITKETPEDDRAWISNFQTEMQLAALAFVGAQEEFAQFSSARSNMVKIITSHVFEDYSFTEAGVMVACDVEQQGHFEAIGKNVLIPSEKGACSFYLRFDMSILK